MTHRAQYGTDLLSSSQDMLTSLDRSAMALNMIAHTLENEFAERFGHTGVRVVVGAAHLNITTVQLRTTVSRVWLLQLLAGYSSSVVHAGASVWVSTHDCIPLLHAGLLRRPTPWKWPSGYASCNGRCMQSAQSTTACVTGYTSCMPTAAYMHVLDGSCVGLPARPPGKGHTALHHTTLAC